MTTSLPDANSTKVSRGIVSPAHALRFKKIWTDSEEKEKNNYTVRRHKRSL